MEIVKFYAGHTNKELNERRKMFESKLLDYTIIEKHTAYYNLACMWMAFYKYKIKEGSSFHEN